MKSARPYVMTTRAEATAQTRDGILRATIRLAGHVPLDAISLAAVADEAGVTVQTVLRQLGSRAQLLDAATALALDEVEAERHVDPGDVERTVGVLVEHYEHRGDGALLLLGQETYDARARRITDAGRRLHERWVAAAFPDATRDQVVDLVVVTDVYAWKLLRRDRGLSQAVTRDRMVRLVRTMLGGPSDE